jgi:hypothetical protein
MATLHHDPSGLYDTQMQLSGTTPSGSTHRKSAALARRTPIPDIPALRFFERKVWDFEI